MLKDLIFILVFPLSLSCDPICDSLCQNLNGLPSCYYGCNCPVVQTKQIDISLKKLYKTHIKSAYDCNVSDVLSCDDITDDTEYYKCLTNKNCLILSDELRLIKELPTQLHSAVQPLKIRSLGKENCESCLYSFTAESYYECAENYCKDKIIKVSKELIEFAHEDSQCSNCKNQYGNDNYFKCLLDNCKEEILEKNKLFSNRLRVDFAQAGVSKCSDCESLVFADDYYNCINEFCQSEVIGKEKLFSIEGISKACGVCEEKKDGAYKTCAYFNCKSEVIEAYKQLYFDGNGAKLYDKILRCKDCVFSYDGEVVGCISDNCEYGRLDFDVSSQDLYIKPLENTKSYIYYAIIATFLAVSLIAFLGAQAKHKHFFSKNSEGNLTSPYNLISS